LQVSRKAAFLLAVAVTSLNAIAFWSLSTPDGVSTLLSFWNRPFAERAFLTVLYVLFSARILVWYHDRMLRYAHVRGRGAVRLWPLAFGVSVFGSTLAWWLTVVIGIPAIELHAVLFRGAEADWTVVLLPFSYFVQLLFLSRSTIIWFLAAGVTWPLVSMWPATGRVLSGYYTVPAAERAVPPLGWLKVWNVFGYLVFLLSLLFQSG
jgi:hypothetical protein